jgi:hypothetical protein
MDISYLQNRHHHCRWDILIRRYYCTTFVGWFKQKFVAVALKGFRDEKNDNT